MGYAEQLVQMLLPLGVYTFREGSFSLGELQALGLPLDAAAQWAQKKQRESLVMTAQDEGLSKMERLFRACAPAQTAEGRRAAIAGFLQIGGDSFTLDAINACLSACCVPCLVEELQEVNHVKVSFPGIMGIPDGFGQMRIIIEDILPCQLDIFYYFRYCTWEETERYGLRWQDVGKMTWQQWMEHYQQPTDVSDTKASI